MFSISSMRLCRDAFAVLAMGVFSLAYADGPVSVANLPGGGGNVVTDTDVTLGGGLGQQWGRNGGRTITYHVNNPATFNALTFSVIQTTSPSVAFDGQVNAGTNEVLTYSSQASSLGSGMARWVGSAVLPLANQAPVTVQ